MALLSKAEQLERLKQSIIEDRVCPELARQANNLVFGEGNINADIVLIGEAPGKKEDESGLPFVGASGKFLDEMLEQINLARTGIYITNIVKYRPPDNRDPLESEKQLFLPYLQKQLQIIQPKLIVTLGRHAASCFLPEIKLVHQHGIAVQLSLSFSDSSLEVTLIPMYHPAAALYNGSMRQTLMDDFMKLPDFINEIDYEQLERIN